MFPVDAKIKTKVTNSLHLSITNLFHQFDNRIESGRVVEVDEERERERERETAELSMSTMSRG